MAETDWPRSFQAFRLTNNNDLTTSTVAPGGITLPDVLTESDLFVNLDASLLLPAAFNLEPEGKHPDMLDLGSQLLPDSSFRRSVSEEPARLEDHTLVDLDLGEDDEMPLGHDMSVEVGRDAPAPRPMEEDLYSDGGKFNDDVDLPLDLGEDEDMGRMDVDMADDNGRAFDLGDDDMMAAHDSVPPASEGPPELPEAGPSRQFTRESESPLSEIPSENFAGDAETTRGHEEDEDDVVQQQEQQHRSKRRKVIGLDGEIMLRSRDIREQQRDRSNILKPMSFLPRDPVLLTLLTMQKNGDFVTNVMGAGRGRGWAPELRELMSFDSIKKSGELKRKRDSGGNADMDMEAATEAAEGTGGELALELGEEEGVLPVTDEGLNEQQPQAEILGFVEEAVEELPMRGASDDGGEGGMMDDMGGDLPPMEWDDAVEAGPSTAALPDNSGPVSAGTKHAVHVLREQLDGDEQRKKTGLLFQDIMPEKQTSRADATKMFFEVLALATKDAVKVEQKPDVIGGPLKIEGKQALWGVWAEENAESVEQIAAV